MLFEKKFITSLKEIKMTMPANRRWGNVLQPLSTDYQTGKKTVGNYFNQVCYDG